MGISCPFRPPVIMERQNEATNVCVLCMQVHVTSLCWSFFCVSLGSLGYAILVTVLYCIQHECLGVCLPLHSLRHPWCILYPYYSQMNACFIPSIDPSPITTCTLIPIRKEKEKKSSKYIEQTRGPPSVHTVNVFIHIALQRPTKVSTPKNKPHYYLSLFLHSTQHHHHASPKK